MFRENMSFRNRATLAMSLSVNHQIFINSDEKICTNEKINCQNMIELSRTKPISGTQEL